MSEQHVISPTDVASLTDTARPDAQDQALPPESADPAAPIAPLPPEPVAGEEGAPPPPVVPADFGALDVLDGVVAGERYSKSIYVAHGYYVDVPDVDPETMEQKRDEETGELLTVQIEKDYVDERGLKVDHYVTELGPNERGNLLVGAGTPVSAEVAALLAG